MVTHGKESQQAKEQQALQEQVHQELQEQFQQEAAKGKGAAPDQMKRIADALGVDADLIDIGLPETKPGTWGTGGTYSQ